MLTRAIGDGFIDNFQVDEAPPAVPEPGSLMLLGTGVLGVARAVRRRRAAGR